jgi:alpha-methylacyl-CoA racemase
MKGELMPDTGPLTGFTVIEFGGIGPVPFTGMLLARLGARVIRVEAPRTSGIGVDTLSGGKEVVMIDAKSAVGRKVVLQLCAKANALLEGFRPGVMERLGLGPDEVMKVNRQMIYVRVTGWGREGVLATRAGHDINYLAISGVLSAMGPTDSPPVVPLNLVADFGGGAMLAAVSLLSAWLEQRAGGDGRVIDVNMVDASLLLMTMARGMMDSGQWNFPRGENILDGGAPFYRTYACLDGSYVAVGALEPKFFVSLTELLGLDDEFPASVQYERSTWPEMARRFGEVFGAHSRDYWEQKFLESDCCATVVLDSRELAGHPLHRERSSFGPDGAVTFSRSSGWGGAARRRKGSGTDARSILAWLGYAGSEIDDLFESGVVA